MSRLHIDLKRQEVEESLAELERLVFDAEMAYEQAVAQYRAMEEWENEEV